MTIPKVIHQLWKSPDTPARFAPFRESWLRRNPGWTMRLWTDGDLATLVERRYPELAGLFHGYEHPIARADLGRYLVLEAFGGVYADLDCECLRPLEPMLDDQRLVIGLEPDEHLREVQARAPGLTRLLCPSFIATVPGHAFWRDVRAAAQASAREPDILDKTGPFMLTRAFEASPAAADATVAPASRIYPFTKAMCWSGEIFDLEVWERVTRDAVVGHYWDGGWFRRPTPLDGIPWQVPVRFAGRAQAPLRPPAEPASTRISCVTVANGAAGLDLALESYRRQTHPNKELLVVCPAVDDAVAEAIGRTGRSDIRLLVAPFAEEDQLRAEGVRRAAGDVVCRWDAGVLHDPARLEIQLKVMRQAQAQACLMERRLGWHPAARQLAITAAGRVEAGALMWVRDAVSEETLGAFSVERLTAETRVALFDIPRLLLRVWDGADGGFAAEWASAATRFEAERCNAVADELAKRLPMALATPRAPNAERPARRAAPTGEVLILTPMKDARRHLPRYLELATRLDTGGAPLSIAILEGDSRDGTYEALEPQLDAVRDRFARVVLLQRHDGLELAGPRWEVGVQRARRAAIARARNRLLAEALDGAEWALWLDVDVADYPPDLFTRLAASRKDIVAAHCVTASGRTFDQNTFIFRDADRDDPAHLVDDIFQPPPGEGRLYLEDVADQDLVRVDSVGGTALLVRGQLHRDGLNFPAYSYRGYIETEGLAMMARDMGRACWALPRLRVTHASEA